MEHDAERTSGGGRGHERAVLRQERREREVITGAVVARRRESGVAPGGPGRVESNRFARGTILRAA
ncbi:hypothetical protein GCM10017712_01450 [Curtobacterium citreum]